MSEMLSQDPTDETRKNLVIAAVRRFIESNPNFNSADYAGNADGLRYDRDRASRDLRDSRELLRIAEIYLPEKYITESMPPRNRLTIIENSESENKSTFFCEYTAGQYYPVEYRAAACRALSSAIWAWLRDECNHNTAESIRNAAANLLGKHPARQWFR